MVPTRWQENCKKSQWRASNLKSFMMDLAVIIAEFQRESCVLYRKTTHSLVSRPVMEQDITDLCIIRDENFISKVLF